jgi:IclR family acetate operon transcriptional repressor
VSNDYRIGSLDTGLGILLMFMERESITVTEAAEGLGVSRSTAHRALSTLQQRGLVSLPASGRGYVAGPALVEMARPRSLDPEIRRWVRPALDDAVRRVEETVHTTVLLGSQLLLVDGREPEKPVRVALRTGLIRPAYATSAGKLLLSRLSGDQLRALYPREQLMRTTANTISTRTQLIHELELISEQDFAFSRGESEQGLHAVAVLLAGSSWRDRIALMATVPAERGSDAELSRIAEQLRQCADLLGPPPGLATTDLRMDLRSPRPAVADPA